MPPTLKIDDSFLTVLGPRTMLNICIESVGASISKSNQYLSVCVGIPVHFLYLFMLCQIFAEIHLLFIHRTRLFERDKHFLVERNMFLSGNTQSFLCQDKMSVVASQDVCCRKTRYMLWQHKISVVVRHIGGGAHTKPGSKQLDTFCKTIDSMSCARSLSRPVAQVL